MRTNDAMVTKMAENFTSIDIAATIRQIKSFVRTGLILQRQDVYTYKGKEYELIELVDLFLSNKNEFGQVFAAWEAKVNPVALAMCV